MIEYYKKVVFENYANFNGRARRSEYWMYTLANVLIFIAFLMIGGLAGLLFDNGLAGLGIAYGLFIVYTLATIVPNIAVLVRRLHDIGKSGWFYFISLVPFIGGIWLLILLCTEGDNLPNEYGPDPKNEGEEINEIGNVELQ